jgi:hypothetical protein
MNEKKKKAMPSNEAAMAMYPSSPANLAGITQPRVSEKRRSEEARKSYLMPSSGKKKLPSMQVSCAFVSCVKSMTLHSPYDAALHM